ncbi:MAG: hypothetical protein INR69_13250 [Mucilaginibacter polytrichastri]|nr:hypothetical protein [Mucilaginibacter polytrichastri]
MKPLHYILASFFIGLSLPSLAQTYAPDALNFSRTEYGTTSRLKAIGGAGVAVGGDLSSISLNPAGLGFFTGSEFNITPQYTQTKNGAVFLNASSSGTRDNINLNNLSAVWYIPGVARGSDRSKGWLSFNIGLGVSRTNDFTSKIFYGGTNPKNSIADSFADEANTYNAIPDNLGTDIVGDAYDNGLIAERNATDNTTYVPLTEVNNRQAQNSLRSGGQSEINLSMGANYSNKLYLGAALGIATIRYNFDGTFDESGYNTFRDQDYSTTYSQTQRTSGVGVNAKLGMIFKPVQAFRIGAMITTPTWYTIDDNYSNSLATDYVGGGRLPTDPNQYSFSYRMRTPWKFSGGAAVFLNKFGFLTADVDYVDYSDIRMRGDYNVASDQQYIGQNYKSAINYRFGAEFNILNQFFLRGGYNVMGNPYQNLEGNQFDVKTISGGFGYRFQNYYVDVTYQNVKNSDYNSPYTISSSYFIYDASGPAPIADVTRKTDRVFLTFGARF